MKKRKKITKAHEIPTSTVKWKPREDGEPMMIGYARVSMSDQSNQRQIDALVTAGVHPTDIFQDKKSGKTIDREGWKNCFRDLQEGDLLVIYSLDRLGRNLGDLIAVEKMLYDKGVKLKVIAQQIDTSNPAGRFMFHILGALAQWEREWNWERTMHGLNTARERGRIGGQPEKYSDKQVKDALKQGKTLIGAAKLLGCAKATIKRRVDKWDAQKRKAKKAGSA